MAEKDSSRKAQAPLVDRVLQCGKTAFDPSLSEESRVSNREEFNNLIARFVCNTHPRFTANNKQYQHIVTHSRPESFGSARASTFMASHTDTLSAGEITTETSRCSAHYRVHSIRSPYHLWCHFRTTDWQRKCYFPRSIECCFSAVIVPTSRYGSRRMVSGHCTSAVFSSPRRRRT